MHIKYGKDRLSLGQVARQVGVNISTVWRWSLKGVRGVKLDTFCIGGKRFTSEESLDLFVQATTAARTPLAPQTATPRQREAAISQAERELDRDGI